MADRSAAERAVKDANPIIDGRKANVNLAYLGAKPRGNTVNGFPVPVRTGFPTVLPSQYGLSPHYIYTPPYVTSSSVLLPSHVPLSPASAAAAAWHVYDYAAAYQPAQYASGLDPANYTYPTVTSAPSTGYGSTSYLPPQVYPYNVPQALPGVGTVAGLPPYVTQSQLQETRLQ
ncbi:RNA-binding protein 38-like [Limulus polyphemus]|uniref:RNA-binding protein 38-like n=1 Tax=Limulus polyphemus TaxID=6850 RepID=A0ABM1TG62_LIMPO|nr:RNA-binding protein 38-like [Limulus polyphemus]